MSREALAPIDRLPLADVAAHVAALIQPDTPHDQVADIWQQSENAKRLLAHILEVRDERLLEWMAANGPLLMGDTKVYPGKKTSEKCRDLRVAVEAALGAVGGDWDQFVSLLASGALKPGECSKVIGEEFRSQHFEKTTSPKVEVKTVNQRYLPKKGASNG